MRQLALLEQVERKADSKGPQRGHEPQQVPMPHIHVDEEELEEFLDVEDEIQTERAQTHLKEELTSRRGFEPFMMSSCNSDNEDGVVRHKGCRVAAGCQLGGDRGAHCSLGLG